jgi:F-type H+-transporting ATPase subunit b
MEVNGITLIVQVINFFVLLIVLKSVLYEPMVKAVGERKAAVAKMLAEAESLNAEARKLQSEYEKKLASSKEEALQIVATATAEAERQRTQIVEDAKAEAQRILDKARGEIERERATAMGDVRGRVVELSVEMASQLFRDTLTPDQHQKLVQQFNSKAATLHVG